MRDEFGVQCFCCYYYDGEGGDFSTDILFNGCGSFFACE
jgi:hypothetical protein